ncbi:slipin family protein [Microlunatus elymi]|nr:slipin family protein [Microlunatus elymi]
MKQNLFSITVNAHERALEFTDGRLSRVLEPGRYRRVRRAEFRVIDIRDQLMIISPQDVPAADGVQVKVSATLRWHVDDPVAFDQVAADPAQLVYAAVQVAIRESVAAIASTDLAGVARRDLGSALTETATAAGRELGIGIRTVQVKDVLLPGEIRSAVLEALVAQRQGVAKLEAARAETAALRSMANAAKLLDDHPALAQLRLLQSAPYGTKIVMQLPGGDRVTDVAVND